MSKRQAVIEDVRREISTRRSGTLTRVMRFVALFAFILISSSLLLAAASAAAADETSLPPPPPPVATPPAPAHEADKAPYFRRLAPLLRPSGKFSETPFCTGFLRDLAAMHGIRFAEPIWRAATYDDPKLQSFRHSCHDPDLDKVFSPGWIIAKEGDRALDTDGNPGVAYYLLANFALYSVDLLNVSEPDLDGPSWVLYGEGRCRRYDPHDCLGSAYYLIRSYDRVSNEEVCGQNLIGQAEGPYDYSGPAAVKIGETGIIKYKGLNLILSAHMRPQIKGPPIGGMSLTDAYRLPQNDPRTESKDNAGTACFYTPIDADRSWERIQ